MKYTIRVISFLGMKHLVNGIIQDVFADGSFLICSESYRNPLKFSYKEALYKKFRSENHYLREKLKLKIESAND